MKIHPRFTLLVLGFLLATFAGAHAASVSNDLRALHVLNRLGFGPRPGDLEEIESIGVDTYINQQLNPTSIHEPPDLKQKLSVLETLCMPPGKLFKVYGPPLRRFGRKRDPQVLKEARQRARIIMIQAVQARLMRAIESPRQLQETMVDFWYNHFNVYAGKGLDHLWAGAFEEDAIRPHVLGRFRDLLGVTAKHPAMLFYLDNWKNTSPDSRGAHKAFKGLNENYARELMELHSLGVEGGYTQKDVIELARILTGWGLSKGRNYGANSGFYFDAEHHDFGEKNLLGHILRGSGIAEGEEALDILASSPATAHHICYQLAQYFIRDKPDSVLVDRLAKRFSETDGDIRSVLEMLFYSSEFWDERNYASKFKTPYQFVVSSIRATGIQVENFRMLYGALRQFGMPLYGCLTPDGYKNTQEAWLNSNSMLQRLNFVTALGNRSVCDAASLSKTLGGCFSERTKKVMQKSPARLRTSILLGSPEFMRR